MPFKKKKISSDADEVVSKKLLGKREEDDEEKQDTGSKQDEEEDNDNESTSDAYSKKDKNGENYVPQHESLAKLKNDKERLERTVFVGNLPVSTIGKVGNILTFKTTAMVILYTPSML